MFWKYDIRKVFLDMQNAWRHLQLEISVAVFQSINMRQDRYLSCLEIDRLFETHTNYLPSYRIINLCMFKNVSNIGYHK